MQQFGTRVKVPSSAPSFLMSFDLSFTMTAPKGNVGGTRPGGTAGFVLGLPSGDLYTYKGVAIGDETSVIATVSSSTPAEGLKWEFHYVSSMRVGLLPVAADFAGEFDATHFYKTGEIKTDMSMGVAGGIGLGGGWSGQERIYTKQGNLFEWVANSIMNSRILIDAP